MNGWTAIVIFVLAITFHGGALWYKLDSIGHTIEVHVTHPKLHENIREDILRGELKAPSK